MRRIRAFIALIVLLACLGVPSLLRQALPSHLSRAVDLAQAAPADATPILNLHATTAPLPLTQTLQDPSQASAWYTSSPTWYGLGGKTGDRDDTEVLSSYDSQYFYVAFLNIDRSRNEYPTGSHIPLTDADSNAIWLQNAAGQRFAFIAAMNTTYPPQPVQASGRLDTLNPATDTLAWQHNGWHNQDTLQQTIRIPWTSVGGAPAVGGHWQADFITYNQTAGGLAASTVNLQHWASGALASDPSSWGTLTFDAAPDASAANISPEATLSFRPAPGFGGETTLSPGDNAGSTNVNGDAGIVQSNWNDTDPIQYENKEYLQFDLSDIPANRTIISATLENYFRSPYNSPNTDLYVNVERLAAPYNPATVTMLTSPLPLENGQQKLVPANAVGSWVDFDVTDALRQEFAGGRSLVDFALAGSSGDISNGKAWTESFNRVDWYDNQRPFLRVTFGQPGVTYPSTVQVGTDIATSVATSQSKNKLTNGTFRYGHPAGIANTTYWTVEPNDAVGPNGQPVTLMQYAGDTNPKTGDPGLRFDATSGWHDLYQLATGLTAGQRYTLSAWVRSSQSNGPFASLTAVYKDASGNVLDQSTYTYKGSLGWQQISASDVAPAGTVAADVQIKNWTNGDPGQYTVWSDVQLEAGATPTTYSETPGTYYPYQPRTDGTTGSALCLNLDLLGRTTGNEGHPRVAVEIRDGNGDALVNKTESTNAAGRLTATDLGLGSLPGGPYSLWVKPEGYLAQELTDIPSLTGGCIGFPAAFTDGDFAGQNTISLPDLVTAIKAYNGAGSAITREVYANETVQNPDLIDLVRIIRTYNHVPNGAT
jgi:hypothetical protein